MPTLPRPQWRTIGGEDCWAIDWTDFFRGDLQGSDFLGQMRCFHVVFRIRIRCTGTMHIWDDDGSVIRRNGLLVHEDRTAHALTRSELEVRRGDMLEVAQWQLFGGWWWAAGMQPTEPRPGDDDAVLDHLADVRMHLRTPDGPPLKLYTSGRMPVRAVVAVYSLVLNGYAPSRILLYGEEQWSPRARALLAAALPMAEVVPCAQVLEHVTLLGGSTLRSWAAEHWFVMKACVALLEDPSEFCLIDDDVFILDPLRDALDDFRRCDLVYAPDWNHGAAYRRTWSGAFALAPDLRAGTFNAGLYWCRRVAEPRRLASAMMHVVPWGLPTWVWEQGFIACAYDDRPVSILPAQRYFYPYFDGLPGGVLGYDYVVNPCGFASIHFGGLATKPDDDVVELLAPALLGRCCARIASAAEPNGGTPLTIGDGAGPAPVAAHAGVWTS